VTNGEKQILLATKHGMACRFSEENVRPIGRTGRGVTGIRLNKEDEVIGLIITSHDTNILTITNKGYGKQSKVSDYRLINRGGKGVRNIKLTEKNGHVVSVKEVLGDRRHHASNKKRNDNKNGSKPNINCRKSSTRSQSN
jgi:DNA gyrase subunit A